MSNYPRQSSQYSQYLPQSYQGNFGNTSNFGKNSYKDDFISLVNLENKCSGWAFWSVYVIFVVVISLISISMTASILNNSEKAAPYTLHVITCILFILAAILVVTDHIIWAVVLTLLELLMGILAIAVVKPDNRTL
jgi:hypothetical protein